ncbi:MAG: TolC family protein [Gemmatimonadaceae bacterium]
MREPSSRSGWVARTLAVVLVAVCPSARALAQGALTLPQAIELAQRQSYGARAATSAREAARQRSRAFDASLLPQLSLSGDLPVYNRSIIPVTQPDGSTLFKAQQLSSQALNLRVTQRLPFTGGDLFVQSSLSRLQIAGQQSEKSWSSTPFLVGVRQSILRPNALAWDTKEQDLSLTVAERQYLENREDVAIATANSFFDLYSARTELENAVTNVAVNDTLYTLSKGRYEVGKIGENDLLQSELALLRSRNALATAKLNYDRSLAAFRLQLNLPIDAAVDVMVTSDVPPVQADTTLAVVQALKNRALVTNQELQTVQARRRVSDARLNSGLGATLEASVGYNQTAPDVNLAYRDLLNAQRLTLSVSMPILQWGGRGAQIQAAKADQDRVESNARLAREQLSQDAYFAARQIDQSRDQLALSAKADTVASKRFEVAKNRYVIGRIGIDNLYIAQSEKDQALRAYVDALRGFWLAYYRLRRTTLYDFGTGQQIR